jgi:hypothetical protein
MSEHDKAAREIEALIETLSQRITAPTAELRREQDEKLWERLAQSGVLPNEVDQVYRARFISGEISIVDLSDYLSKRLGWIK